MELELDEVKLKESQVRKLKHEDITRIRVRGDGCYLYRAALTGANLDANQHLELRNAVNESILSQNYDISLLGEGQFNSKEEYYEHMSNPRSYGSYLELQQIAQQCEDTWFLIYLKDERYKDNPWQIVRKDDKKVAKEAVYLLLDQGLYTIQARNAHYEVLRFRDWSPNNIAQTKIALANFIKFEHTQVKNKLRILVWNVRSIKDWTKKKFLSSLLQNHEIDIAFIQETFLSPTDKWFIRGYRIIRSDNFSRRKGSAILINEQLNVSVRRLLSDQEG